MSASAKNKHKHSSTSPCSSVMYTAPKYAGVADTEVMGISLPNFMTGKHNLQEMKSKGVSGYYPSSYFLNKKWGW